MIFVNVRYEDILKNKLDIRFKIHKFSLIDWFIKLHMAPRAW